MALVNQTVNVKYSEIDYGSVPAMNLALMRNDTQLMVNTPGSIKGQLDSGELVALAVINAERYPNLPNVPSLREVGGYTGFIPTSWAGFFGPKGLPRDLTERINALINRWMVTPEVVAFFEQKQNDHPPIPISVADFEKVIQADLVSWKKLIDAAGVKAE